MPDYDLLRRVGSGAYGEIWLARSLATGVLRAAKIVWRRHFDDDRPFQREFEGIQRFERVSRGHPSQLALFHIGRNDAAGYFYYVMELADPVEVQTPELQNLVSGFPTSVSIAKGSTADSSSEFDVQASDLGYVPHTLRSDLGGGRLPAAEVLELGLALSEALANLHSHGLVHRDVKPSNVIVVNGRPKLADIGLVTDAGDGRSIVGTEGYLAPEGPGTPQADLFALGKVLYESSTGLDRRRFPRLPPDLRSWEDARLVLELNEIIVKACAPNPKDRYQRAEDMRADLELLKTGRSVKRLRTVERRLALLNRAAVVVTAGILVVAGVFYETYRQRQAVLRSLVRLQVANGTDAMNEGNLFDSLLHYTEALRLEAGNHKREENHRIRIASILRECPKLVGMFTHPNAVINDAAFSPDSRRVVTVGEDHIAQIWDLASGERQFLLPHIGRVYSADFSPDGERIATTTDGLVHLWNSHSGKPIPTAPIRHRAWNNGPSPEFSPDGSRLLTMPDLHTLVIWNANTGDAMGKPLRHDQEIHAFMFSPDGRHILSISNGHKSQLWDAFTGELVYSFRHESVVKCGAFSIDGRTVATGSEDGSTRFWDLTSGDEIAPPIFQGPSVDFLAFSPEGDRLATASGDGAVELWDITTRRSLLRPLVRDRRLFRVNFSPDGRWLAVSSEGNRVRLWDTDTGELLPPPFVHDTPRRPIMFSPDGHLILTLRHDLTLEREEVAMVWSLAREEAPSLKVPPVASFRKESHSRDGRYEAILNGDTVRTLIAGSEKPMTQPLKQNLPFRQACFNHDNSLLLTESIGGRGQIWDLSRGEPLTFIMAIAYDRNADALSKADLPHDLHSVGHLLSLAEMLSGNRIDETGGFRSLDKYALAQRWNDLKRENPEAFIDSETAVQHWHERQAADCEQAWNWWSAVFHLRALLAKLPGDSRLEKRLAYAELALNNAQREQSGYLNKRTRVVPPRDPQEGPEVIDLSQYYNRSKRNKSMASLPSGLQTFGGTGFDVRGVIQLLDADQAEPLAPFTKEVRGIRINRACHRLHFLQATASSCVDGTEVSSFVIHYSNQKSLTITNIYGHHLRSWWTQQKEPLNAAEAALVWMGTNHKVESDDPESMRIFKRTWQNPWPEVEITSIDFLSNHKGVGPFLVALTAD